MSFPSAASSLCPGWPRPLSGSAAAAPTPAGPTRHLVLGRRGAKPKLAQWYHEYGEDGVQEAVKRYAKAYDKADVTVKWNPGDYDKLVSAALLTANVPDVFEYGNGPTLDMIKAGQVLDLDRDARRSQGAVLRPGADSR